MPKYPGGDEAMLKYLSENITYPENARKNGIQGTVYVTFVVEKDGSISDVNILRGLEKECDEVALQAVKNMPAWTTGKQRGKPVRVQFNLPLKFKLNEEKEVKKTGGPDEPPPPPKTGYKK
nr:energy transducer TonB [Bacteroidota bacterium]